MTDVIADMLTRIRNANDVGHPEVDIPSSKMKVAIAKTLKEEGYIKDYEVIDDGKQGILKILLRYTNGVPAIQGLQRYSRPGLRQYAPADRLPKVRSGLGFAILSTPQGVMTDHEARKLNVGGEILCKVW